MSDDGPKVLVIDDKEDNLVSLAAMLRAYLPGCEVATARSGREGIERARAVQPDAILLDIQMPGMDGFQVCRALKGDPATRHLPVIFLTAQRTDPASRIRGLELGGDAFLTKPVEPGELMAQVRAMVRIKRAEDALRGEKQSLEMEVTRRTAALTQSEERFRLLFEQAPIGYQSLDVDGHFLEVNDAWLAMLGYAREEVVGRWFGEFLAPGYQDHFRADFPRFKEAEETRRAEFRMVHKDGSTPLVSCTSKIGKDELGGFRQTHCVLFDITESRKAEEALRHSEERHRTILATAMNGFWVADLRGRLLEVNAAYCQMSGYSEAELLAMRVGDLEAPESKDGTAAYIERMVAGDRHHFESRHRRKDGTEFDVEVSVTSQPTEGGCLVAFLRDITERKRAEEVLRESEERFKAIANYAVSWESWFGPEGKYIWTNPAVEFFTGYSAQEILALPDFVSTVVADEDRAIFIARFQEAVRGSREDDFEFRYLHKNGTKRWLSASWQPIYDAQGNPLGTRSSGYDITTRKQAEEALRASQQLAESIIESTPGAFYMLDEAGNYVRWNEYQRDEIVGKPEDQVAGTAAIDTIHPDDRALIQSRIENVLRNGEVESVEGRVLLRGGPAFRWLLMTGRRMVIGGSPFLVGIGIDITERKLAEEALGHSEEKYRELVESVSDVIFEIDVRGCFVYVSPVIRTATGYEPEELVGRAFVEFVHPDDHVALIRRFSELVKGIEKPWEYRILTKSGEVRWVRTLTRAAAKGESFWGARGTLIDITERKRAEEALSASRAQLLQSQKMEAVGRLAGGVAHDFNNILQAMLSLATVLRLKAGSPELAKIVAEIETHVKRGAGLTQQLLLFSRRQVAEKKRLDLGELASAAGTLLRRLIPENIRLTVDTAPERLWVDGDAGQLQQVLMNLAVNAKDAMPGGGTLTVRTRCAGSAAVVEVIDTGHGMDEETRSHLFEPFFTTKDTGKGTGLGLSVVHGIVEQHGGRVEVESAPGEGSTFRVTLPTVTAPEEAANAQKATTELLRGNGERVLIVEDEDGARKGLAELLTILGYTVTAVGSGEEAGVLPAEPAPDLLLTDLMLPGIDGAALAAGLRGRWPGMKVVLMSGYTEDEAVRRGVNEGEVSFLQKPFDMAALARALYAALDAGARNPV